MSYQDTTYPDPAPAPAPTPTPTPTQPPACPTGQEWNRYRRKCENKGPLPPGGGGYGGGGNRPPKRPSPPRGGWNSCSRSPWRYKNCHDEAKYYYFTNRRWPSWWFWGDVWPISFGWPRGRGSGICSAIFGGTCNRECGPRGSPSECLDCSYACGPSWRSYGQRYGHKMDVNVYNITNEFTNEGYGAPREEEAAPVEVAAPPPAPAGFDMSSLTSSPIILIGGALMLMMFMMKK